MTDFVGRLLVALLLPFSLWILTFNTPETWPIALLSSIASYFFPAIEAKIRKSPDFLSIAVLNFFLGWTLVGWVVALIWSVRTAGVQSDSVKMAAPAKTTINPAPVAYRPTLPDVPKKEAARMKTCPFCAEEILQAAIICKHCRSDLASKEAA